jgi:flavin-binding protein dodecin
MAVAGVAEIKASFTGSCDHAIEKGAASANKALKKHGAGWIENREAIVDDKGGGAEYRVQLRITFMLEGYAEY